MFKAVSMVALALAVASAAVAGMYKWTDAQGSVHYGERPPPGSEAREIKPAAPPPEEEAERDRERWDRILERQQRSDELRREDKERRQQEKAAQQQRELERKRMCASARSNLQTLEQQRPVYRIDDKGERVFLDADQRASEIARLKALIAEHCR